MSEYNVIDLDFENLPEEEKNKAYGTFLEKFILLINRARNKVLLYSKTHPEVKIIIQEVLDFLNVQLRKKSPITLLFKANKIIVDGIFSMGEKDIIKYFSSDLTQKGIESITFERGIDYESLYKILYLVSLEHEKVSRIGKKNLGLETIVGVRVKEIDYLKLREMNSSTAKGEFTDEKIIISDKSTMLNFLQIREGFGSNSEEIKSLVGNFKDIPIPDTLKPLFGNIRSDEMKILRGEERAGTLSKSTEGRIASFFVWMGKKINDIENAEENAEKLSSIANMFFSQMKETKAKIVIASVDANNKIPKEIIDILKCGDDKQRSEIVFQIKVLTYNTIAQLGQKLVKQIQNEVKGEDKEKEKQNDYANDNKIFSLKSEPVDLPENTIKEIQSLLSEEKTENHKNAVSREIFLNAEIPEAIMESIESYFIEFEDLVAQQQYDEALKKYRFIYERVSAGNKDEILKKFSNTVYERIIKKKLFNIFLSAIGTKHDEVTNEIMKIISDLNQTIFPLLAEVLVEIEDRRIRKRAIDFLVQNNQPSDEVLTNLLKNQDWRVVRNAVTIIKETKRATMVTEIISILGFTESRVIEEVLSALSRIQNDESVEGLCNFYKDYTKDRKMRLRVIDYLANIKNPKVLPILIEVFNERDVDDGFWERKETMLKSFANFPDKEVMELLRAFIKRPYIFNFRKWGNLKNIAKEILGNMEKT